MDFSRWLAGGDPATGSLPVLVQVAAAVALVGVLVFVCVFAFDRLGRGQTDRIPAPSRNWIWRGALVVAGTLMLWSILERPAARDAGAERRALDMLANELTLRTLTPGSPLACLDAVDNPAVEDSCEAALFGSAQATAAALAYVDARLTLLADGLRLAAFDASVAGEAERLRRGIEADRFGFVAQVLATRGCGAGDCAWLKLLRDPARVLANLKGRTFAANVAMYSSNWRGGAATASRPVSTPDRVEPGAALPASGGTPGSSHFDYPSASSIPPVSIMNPEPAPPPAAEHPAPAAKPAPAARRAAPREPPAPPMAIAPPPATPSAPAGTLVNPR